MTLIDLRSDTVTQPDEGMRKAMAQAQVGDDVYGEDPTIRALEEKIAALLGHSHGLFVPSGTMGNQIALRVHTNSGDEVIIEDYGHSFAYETGAMAALAGVQAKTVSGERGIMSVNSIQSAINPFENHFARTSLVVVENTANRGGGSIYPLSLIKEVKAVTTKHQLKLHMDGARLWNAHVATGTALQEYGHVCDSVSICLSKGLGAPVGSILVGDESFSLEARRLRKMYGGGMRQAGILAAGALYALEHNLPRIAQDHRRLQKLARGLQEIPALDCNPEHYPTNIAYATITNGRTAHEVVQSLLEVGVLVHAMGPTDIRFVTHLDLDDQDIQETLKRIRRIFS